MRPANALLAAALLVAAGRASAFDYSLVLGNNGSQDYVLTEVSDPSIFSGALPVADPDLFLYLGKRYRIVVTGFSFHPLQLIAKSASPAQDIVLLAQGSTVGPLESNSEIAWFDNGQGTVEFTVTQGLLEAMSQGGRNPGYRCQPHTASMRGNIGIIPFPEQTPVPSPTPTVTPEPPASSSPAVVFSALTTQHWEPFSVEPFLNAPTFDTAGGLGLSTTAGRQTAFGLWQTRALLDPVPEGLQHLRVMLEPTAPREGFAQPEFRVRVFSEDNSFSSLAVTAQTGGASVREMVDVYFKSDGTSRWRVAIDLIGALPESDGGAVVKSIALMPVDSGGGHVH